MSYHLGEDSLVPHTRGGLLAHRHLCREITICCCLFDCYAVFFCRHASSTTDTEQNHQCSLCPSLVEQSNVDAVCNVVLKSAPKGAAGASTQDMP